MFFFERLFFIPDHGIIHCFLLKFLRFLTLAVVFLQSLHRPKQGIQNRERALIQNADNALFTILFPLIRFELNG